MIGIPIPNQKTTRLRLLPKHDPEKHAFGLDPRVATIFRIMLKESAAAPKLQCITCYS